MQSELFRKKLYQKKVFTVCVAGWEKVDSWVVSILSYSNIQASHGKG